MYFARRQAEGVRRMQRLENDKYLVKRKHIMTRYSVE